MGALTYIFTILHVNTEFVMHIFWQQKLRKQSVNGKMKNLGFQLGLFCLEQREEIVLSQHEFFTAFSVVVQDS